MTDTDLTSVAPSAVDPDPRAKQLLKLLVEHYIAEGTPVASKALATLPGVEVSSATVRNVMSDLESMGLCVRHIPRRARFLPSRAALFRRHIIKR